MEADMDASFCAGRSRMTWEQFLKEYFTNKNNSIGIDELEDLQEKAEISPITLNNPQTNP